MVCEDAQEVTFTVNNNFSGLLTNINISLPLQDNMNYIGASANIDEIDVSDLENPVLGFLTDTIFGNSSVSFTVDLRTVCGYIDALGTNFSDIPLVMTYDLNGVPQAPLSTSSNIQGNTFVVNRPEVIFSVSPTSQAIVPVRDSLNLTFTIEQSNNLAYLTRVFAVVNHYDRFVDVEFSIPGYGIITPTTSSATREFFTIDTNIIKTQGDLDIFLEDNEVITINATYWYQFPVNPAGYFLTFGAGYSCDAAVTASSQFCVPSTSPYNPVAPNITSSGQRANSGVLYEDVTGAGCLGGLDTTTYVLYNIHTTENALGARAMYDVNFWYRSNGVQSPFFNTPYWQLVGFIYQDVNYVDVSDTTDLTRTTLSSNLPFFNTDFDGPGGFSDMDGDGIFDDIAVGDTVRIKMVVLRKSDPPAGVAGFSSVFEADLYSYKTQFGQIDEPRRTSSSNPVPEYPADFNGDNRTCFLGAINRWSDQLHGNIVLQNEATSLTLPAEETRFVPTTVVVGTTYPLIFQNRGGITRVAIGDSVEIGFHVEALPGISFTSANSNWDVIDNGDGTAVYRRWVQADDICSSMGMDWVNGSPVRFQVTCDYYPLNGGDFCDLSVDTLDMDVYYYTKRVGPNSCTTNKEDTIYMITTEKINVVLDNPAQCPVSISNIAADDFSISRLNYGWTDSTRTVLADENTPGASNRFIMGDTVSTFLPGKVYSGTFDSLKIVLNLTRGSLISVFDSTTKVDVFSLLDGDLEVFRGGVPTTLSPVGVDQGIIVDTNNIKYEITYAAGGSLGNFQTGDSLHFNGIWFVKDGNSESAIYDASMSYQYNNGTEYQACVILPQDFYAWRPVLALSLNAVA